MTAGELARGTDRLRELERKERLPPETIRDLKAWWRGVVYREEHKVVSLDEWRERRRWLC